MTTEDRLTALEKTIGNQNKRLDGQRREFMAIERREINRSKVDWQIRCVEIFCMAGVLVFIGCSIMAYLTRDPNPWG